MIEKVISTNLTPITVKKLKNQTLLVEVEKRKHADFLLKMTKLHNISVKTYPHKSLNVSKAVVRSKKLSLCTIEEIRELKKQGVTEVKRVSIKKEGKTIETNTYIMQFNTPKIPEKIIVGNVMEWVEQYIPNPLRCYKCQKYGNHKDNCRGREMCGKCGQRNPDHHINDFQFPCKWTNCGCDHSVYARSCESWRQEKEVLTVKHRNNILYYEARKLVVGYKTSTYSQAVQLNKSPYNKYKTIVKTLIQLDPGDWESFINKI